MSAHENIAPLPSFLSNMIQTSCDSPAISEDGGGCFVAGEGVAYICGVRRSRAGKADAANKGEAAAAAAARDATAAHPGATNAAGNPTDA